MPVKAMVPQRPYFWHIEHVWLFYLLTLVAVTIFCVGTWRHVRRFLQAHPGGIRIPSRLDVARMLRESLAGRRLVKGDLSAGLAHMGMAWGFMILFIGTVMVAIDHYLVKFLYGTTYLVTSLVLDVAGIVFLVGLVWLLARRYLQRVERLERDFSALGVALWLVVVGATGFLVEATRLAATSPSWERWSFAGRFVAGFIGSDAEAAYPSVWWLHALLSLGLVASIPYSRLFHILSAPATLLLANAETRPRWQELLAASACTRCGRCVEVCPPARVGEPFSPRAMVLGAPERATFGDAVWRCTTCGACLDACPIHIAPMLVVLERRREQLEAGTQVPAPLTQALEYLYKYKNPWVRSRKKRASWAAGPDVPDVPDARSAKATYFVGCSTGIDTRASGLAKALSKVLRGAGVDFGTLGNKEPCCGDIARRVGEVGLVEEQTAETREELAGQDPILTSSPHCWYAMSQSGIAAQHYTQFLDDLRQKGTLAPKTRLDKVVTYHDPCYLGRHGGVYDEPRRVIGTIPGVELREMPRSREHSLCCGAGGGRMWQQDLDGATKMSEVRVREAAETGAEILVTACPLCLIMLEDGRKTAGLEDTLQVMDLNELLVKAGAGEGGAPDEEAP